MLLCELPSAPMGSLTGLLASCLFVLQRAMAVYALANGKSRAKSVDLAAPTKTFAALRGGARCPSGHGFASTVFFGLPINIQGELKSDG